MMMPLSLASIPTQLEWKNEPARAEASSPGQLTITAGAQTDWFVDPGGSPAKTNAPVALFAPPDPDFILRARVTVQFGSTFDAGVLFVYIDDARWAKLCFEYSPQRQPMVVSVVTRILSDDCNSTPIEGDSVHLRVHRRGDTLAFHYSLDGVYWRLVRYFALGPLEQIRIGFSAQSPTGQTCTATFGDIRYQPGQVPDLRNGQ